MAGYAVFESTELNVAHILDAFEHLGYRLGGAT
jgi:hypothetical protein